MKNRYRRMDNHKSEKVAGLLRIGKDTMDIALIMRTTEDRVYNLISGYGGIREFLEEWPEQPE